MSEGDDFLIRLMAIVVQTINLLNGLTNSLTSLLKDIKNEVNKRSKE